MLRFVVGVAVLTVGLTATSAFATKLNGKLIISKSFVESVSDVKGEEKKYRGYWNEPNGVIPVLPPAIRVSSDFGVVLYKEGAPAPKADPVSTVNVLTGGMEQNVVVIRPQSRIKFVMQDPFDHELYSPGKHDFKPQKQAQRSFRPVDFYSAGIFEVRCKLMPHFQGWVVVVPATYVLKVKSDGTFLQDELEAGNYTLKVFYNGDWIHEQKFTIEKEREIKLDVKLDVAKAKSGKQEKSKDSDTAKNTKAKKDAKGKEE